MEAVSSCPKTADAFGGVGHFLRIVVREADASQAFVHDFYPYNSSVCYDEETETHQGR